jgi:hypothetical protein
VALSRAKTRLIILANLQWVKETLPKQSKFLEVIARISKMGSIIQIPQKHSAANKKTEAIF